MRIVTLTTDFGTRDYYVGAMKGVIMSIAPQARLVDLSHEIPPQDLLAAAFVLRHAAREFPPDTIHLAVIDPGVGTRRRPLALRAGAHLWVGPDNGLFSFALEQGSFQARQIAPLAGGRLSHTFHGRDLFAPAAARLACGLALEEIGPPLPEDPVRLDEVRPRLSGERIEGCIVHIDHFGNLVSNIPAAALEPFGRGLRVRAGKRVLEGLCTTYADAPGGAPLALIGSTGLLEISVNGGSAARLLGLERRAPIAVEHAQTRTCT